MQAEPASGPSRPGAAVYLQDTKISAKATDLDAERVGVPSPSPTVTKLMTSHGFVEFSV